MFTCFFSIFSIYLRTWNSIYRFLFSAVVFGFFFFLISSVASTRINYCAVTTTNAGILYPLGV